MHRGGRAVSSRIAWSITSIHRRATDRPCACGGGMGRVCANTVAALAGMVKVVERDRASAKVPPPSLLQWLKRWLCSAASASSATTAPRCVEAAARPRRPRRGEGRRAGARERSGGGRPPHPPAGLTCLPGPGHATSTAVTTRVAAQPEMQRRRSLRQVRGAEPNLLDLAPRGRMHGHPRPDPLRVVMPAREVNHEPLIVGGKHIAVDGRGGAVVGGRLMSTLPSAS